MRLVGCLHRCTSDARSHKHKHQQDPAYIKILKAIMLGHCPTVGRVQRGGTVCTCNAQLTKLRLLLALQTMAAALSLYTRFWFFYTQHGAICCKAEKECRILQWGGGVIDP